MHQYLGSSVTRRERNGSPNPRSVTYTLQVVCPGALTGVNPIETLKQEPSKSKDKPCDGYGTHRGRNMQIDDLAYRL